jgi:PAS domain S-box-containing protein
MIERRMEIETRVPRAPSGVADPTAAQLRLLIESVADYAIYLLDSGGRVTSWNASAERIKGYTAAEILGRDFALFYPPEDRAAGRPAEMLARAAREGRATAQGWRVRKDGSRFWADVVLTALRGAAGELAGFAKVTRDLTEQRRAELAQRSLTRRLVQAEETERRRIAAELHDRVGQNLSALNINLDIMLGALSQAAPQNLLMRLHDSLALVDATAQTLENVMADLRPPLLEEYGLGAALSWYVEEFARRAAIEVEFEDLAAERNRSLRREPAVALFRISQEALNNVAKHAHARHVFVRLEADDADMLLTIRDDGRGFDPKSEARASRLGMRTMKERVVAADGTLELESAPGKGTTLRARVPF